MKLRSKETGEIIPAEAREDGIYLFDKTTEQWNKYELPLLAEYWEYCGEPKEYWYIDYEGGILCAESDNSSAEKMMISIGNHFNSLEETEKAVEKLEAYKRLKDKGFRFDCWEENHHNLGIIEFSFEKVENNVWDFKKDLDLLFGGEE